jgi:hypothetical protein
VRDVGALRPGHVLVAREDPTTSAGLPLADVALADFAGEPC